jgi:hypothetical protein
MCNGIDGHELLIIGKKAKKAPLRSQQVRTSTKQESSWSWQAVVTVAWCTYHASRHTYTISSVAWCMPAMVWKKHQVMQRSQHSARCLKLN